MHIRDRNPSITSKKQKWEESREDDAPHHA
jgi:hypothetical protein